VGLDARPARRGILLGVPARSPMFILRHLLAILLLPFMVTVVIPRWLLSAPGDTRWPVGGGLEMLGRSLGVLLLLAGLGLFSWCVVLFARVGRGTLAPWDPTKQLVLVGPYRYVRNPMITGVVAILIGEALYFGSRRLAFWAGIFALLNHVFFTLVEEPGLARRFGRSYLDYKAAVPRWLPRLRARRS
jgi:protein-S-isoprenylcysteine O-methyltransferase Ste14